MTLADLACRVAVAQNASAIAAVPFARRTAELYRRAIAGGCAPSALNAPIPPAALAPDVCEAVVARCGEALAHLPPELVTLELCVSSARSAGLKAVPAWALASKAVCEAAAFSAGSIDRMPPSMRLRLAEQILQRPGGLAYLPPTRDNVWEAVARHGDLHLVPKHMRTLEVCLKALSVKPAALEHMPDRLVTLAMCESAVGRSPSALQFAPWPLRTWQLYLRAWRFATPSDRPRLDWINDKAIVAGDLPWAIERGEHLALVPAPMRTARVCEAAVRRDGMALAWVPDRQRTAQICSIALLQNPMAILFAPNATAEMFEDAVKRNGMALRYAPAGKATEELCALAVGVSGLALQYAPAEARTAATCLRAVRQCGLALEFVPEPLRTEAVCWEAIGQNGAALRWVPEHLRDEALCMAAVTDNGRALAWVPAVRKTFAVCMAAVASDGMAAAYLP